MDKVEKVSSNNLAAWANEAFTNVVQQLQAIHTAHSHSCWAMNIPIVAPMLKLHFTPKKNVPKGVCGIGPVFEYAHIILKKLFSSFFIFLFWGPIFWKKQKQKHRF